MKTDICIRLLLLCLPQLATARRCVPSDYDFEYTECGPDGSRWRVAVPLHGTVCDGLPEPTKGLNCSFSCSAGNYLDIMTESCRPCPPGKPTEKMFCDWVNGQFEELSRFLNVTV
ncbi:unnamed protein product [Haemonchus placei]|uniref:Laminin EGF-like domain-containing protein n=1 Tax=Haemonchus placei TaxID=6290 RepID=A0A0N4WSQ7_HAEPC|nr:unnamed protein product [Haemonchus placei]